MSATGDAGVERPSADDVSELDLGPRIEALKSFLARKSAQPRTEPSEAEAEEDALLLSPVVRLPAPAPPPERIPHLTARSSSPIPDEWTRRLALGGATALAVITALVLVIAGVPASFRAMGTGTLSIETRPSGVAVVVDGTPRGVTPVEIELPPGDHIAELIAGTNRRRVPVTIRAGSQSSQFLEMAASAGSATGAGELRVRTEPLGAAVLVDGRYVGRSPVSVADLVPGTHTVLMQHQGGTVTEQVLIEPGKSAALFVPLQSNTAAGAAGWIAVAAPADLQIYEDGRFLGSSTIERIMLPVGPHNLDIVNEPLGFHERRSVRVTAGQVTPIGFAWPTGLLSINAVPWAEAFVDGTPVGETPIANISVPIGHHEITFRNPKLGERSVAVTVTAREPAKVGVDLSK